MPDRTLVLYGTPVSNYFNVVRAVLLEKGVPFELEIRGAAKDEAFLAINPMGKVPVLRIGNQHFAETVAILEVLDDLYPAKPLRSNDPYVAARMRQAINILQVYVEVPARSLFAGVFVGSEPDMHARTNARPVIDRACGALARLLSPSPFLLGDRLSQVDLFAFFTFDIARRIEKYVYGESTIERIGWFAQWDQQMRSREAIVEVLDDFQPAFERYLIDKQGPYRELAGTRQETAA